MSADHPENKTEAAGVYERQVRAYLDSSRLRPVLQDAVTALLLHTRHLYSDHVAKASAAAEMAGRRADEVLDGMLL